MLIRADMFSLLLLIPFCLASHRSSKLEKWAFINDVILLEHRTGGFLHNCRIWNLYLSFYVIIYQEGVNLSYFELSVRRNSIYIFSNIMTQYFLQVIRMAQTFLH